MKHEHQEWYLGNFLLIQNLTCSYSTGSFAVSPSSLIPITTAIQCTRCLLHVASDESSSLRLSDLIIPVQSSLCDGHESWAMAVKHIVMSLHKRPFETETGGLRIACHFFPSSFLQAVVRTRPGKKINSRPLQGSKRYFLRNAILYVKVAIWSTPVKLLLSYYQLIILL